MQSLMLLYLARMALSSPVLDQGQAILKVEGENTEANIKMANMTHFDHFTLEQGLFNQTISMEYIDIHLLPHHMPYNWDDSVEVFYARVDEKHIGELGPRALKSRIHLTLILGLL